MKKLVQIQIHSSLSSLSTRDGWVYKMVDENEVEKFVNQLKLKFSVEDGVYYLEDNTYCNIGATFNASENQIKDRENFYIEQYGFESEKSEEVKVVFNAIYQAKKLQFENESKIIGRVFPSYDYIPANELTLSDFQGGFSDSFWSKILNENDENLRKYLEQGVVFGYIGSGERLKDIDVQFEKMVIGQDKIKEFAEFVTSSNGRHWADQIEVGMIIESLPF